MESIKDQEPTKMYYYQVPQQPDKTEKQIFVIKESKDNGEVESEIRYYLSKNKLNYPIQSYTFQNQIMSNEFRYNYTHQLMQLDDKINCTQQTYDQFIKAFVPVCQAKFGTHLRIDIQGGEMKSYWNAFVRITILERIINQILKQCRNKDAFIILIMDPLEECIMNNFKGQFSSMNSRAKLFYISTGDYNHKLHLNFCQQLQDNYCTELLDHKVVYTFEDYYPGIENSKNKDKLVSTYFRFATQAILQLFKFQTQVGIEIPLQLYPWSEPSDKVYGGQIAISKIDHGETIAIKHTPNQFVIRKDLDVDQAINLFSFWVNALQLGYNNSDSCNQMIEQAIEFLTQQMETYVGMIDISHVPKNKPIENMTIRQRLIAQQSNRCRFTLILLIKQLSNLLLQDTVGNLSDEESLERMKIGTEVGRFHQRALVMRGLDVETFNKMKQFFIDELKKVRSSLSYESDQEKSIFSFENMKDIFLQDDIIDALNDVKSQYHLISAFPLVGLGVKLERTDGSMINPYLVKVVEIARINANVDTVSIQNTPDKELNLNAGFYIGAEYMTRNQAEEQHGYKQLKWTQYQPKKAVLKDLNETQLFYYKSEQLKERIDGVVPLFGPKDYDLRPLLSTSFFHVLMNFNVMHNVDTCFSEAYLALLSNTLIFLLNQEKSTYMDELLDKIYHSVNIVYGERPFFKTYCELLISNPRQAMVTFHEGHPTQCQDPSKALICLFYLVKNNTVTDKIKIREILEAILQEIVARGVKNLERLHTYFGILGYSVDEFEKIEKDIIKNVIRDVTQYPTIRVMMNEVENALKSNNYFEFTKKCKLYIHKDSFNFMNYGKLNFFTSMKTICSYFLPKEFFSGGLLWIWLLHAQKYPNNYVRNTSEMQTSIFKVYSNIKKQKSIYFIKEEARKIYTSIYQKLAPQYQKEMFLLHISALPYAEAQLLKILPEEQQFNFKFNNVSNLMRNSCLSPKCPFYLKKMSNISEHIKDIDCVIPGFHKTVKLMRNREPEDIYQAICLGRFLDESNYQEFIKNNVRLQSQRVQYFLLKKRKEDYINLIEELIVHYKEIQKITHN